jgi:N utilization substance protein B
MGVRRRGRELAFQVLYQMDLGGSTIKEALKHFLDLKTAQPQAREFAESLAAGAAAKLEGIDKVIVRLSKNWDFARLNSVDRALLRLGSYELLHRPEIPAEVTLNECIELAKAYGSDDSAAFVNGLLDRVKTEKEQAPAPVKKKRGAAKTSKKKAAP